MDQVMNIIVGATGQVGSNLLREIKGSGFPVSAVVRNPGKVRDKSIEIRVADLLDVAVQPIPAGQWKETLLAAGFTDNTAANLSDMTQAVMEGKLVPEWPQKTVRLNTSLEKYIK